MTDNKYRNQGGQNNPNQNPNQKQPNQDPNRQNQDKDKQGGQGGQR